MTRGSAGKALKDEVFLEALAWAKGCAQALDEKELTPRHLGIGFARSLRSRSVKVPDEIRSRIEALSSDGTGEPLALPKRAKAIRGRNFPLSSSLRGIVARHAGSLEELLEALRAHLSGPTSPTAPAYSSVARIAAQLATRRGETEIAAEVFAASAYLACLEGMLDDVASIASYLVANSDACDALVTSLVPGGFTAGDGPVAALPLSRQLAEALAGEGKDTEKLRRAINAGLAKGVQLASEPSTAYHEAGHAVVSAILRPALMVTKVTIVPDEKNSSAGTISFDPESAYWKRDWTQRNFRSSLCVLMAGRAAEIIKLGPDQASTGALSDIANATEKSWQCITESGLDEEFGPISLSTIAKQSGQSGGWAFDLAQRRVHHVLREAAARADAILRANWTAVERVASALLEHKTLDDTMFLSTLVRKSLEGIPGVVRATSRPVRRNIVFATRPGTIDTAEGPVRHRKGDAIITGAEGERWPASRSYVEARYIPVDGRQMGTDGVYEKIPHVVRALRLMQPGRVDLLGAMGILSGEAGDWIVDYGEGDVALVGRSKFPALYEVEG